MAKLLAGLSCGLLLTLASPVEESACDADQGQCQEEFVALQASVRGRQNALEQEAKEPTDIEECKNLIAGSQCPSSVEGINTALPCQYNKHCTKPGGPVGCWGATGCQYYDIEICKSLKEGEKCPEAAYGINTALYCVYNEKCLKPGGPAGCWGATGCQYAPSPTPALLQENPPTDIEECKNLTAGDPCPSSVEGINTDLTCQYNKHCTTPGGPVGCWGSTGCQYYDLEICKSLKEGDKCPEEAYGINTDLYCAYNDECLEPDGPAGCWGATGCQYVPSPTPALLQKEPTDIDECKVLSPGDQCPSSVEGINTALTCQYNQACTKPGGPVGCWGATGCQYYNVDPCKALGDTPAQCPSQLPGINTDLQCVYNENCLKPGGPVGCWGASGCQYYTAPTLAPTASSTPAPAPAPTPTSAQEPIDIEACKALSPGDKCPSSVTGINTALTCQYNQACTKPGGPVGCWGATGCQYYNIEPCKALGDTPAQCPIQMPGINTHLQCVYNEKCLKPGGPVGCWGASGCQYYTRKTSF